MKGLINRCVSQVTVVDRVRSRAEASKVELSELKAWKSVHEKKFNLTKRLLEEAEEQSEVLKKVLKDKENKISQSKKLLHRAKEDAIKEYRDSDALLAELGGSFADDFDNCLRQVKASFPNLDLSHITIDAKGQTPARPVESKGIEDLFVDDANPNTQVEEEAIHGDQEKSIEDDVRHLEVDQTTEEKDEENPVAQQQSPFFFFSFFLYFSFSEEVCCKDILKKQYLC